jgi:MoxR-like ATPase
MPRFDSKADDKVTHIKIESGEDTRRGVHYKVDDELANAINVALAIGRPLLVSGEPGSGKTELGFAIARKLGIETVHFFPAKSDSEARTLFYEFDALSRFRAAQAGEKGDALDPRRFITYRALGRAILDAYGAEAVDYLATPTFTPANRPTRSVVIIDEIDKAPRDFPNDLLNEIDQLWFRVPEMSSLGKVKTDTPRVPLDPDYRPIVVITSNLERQLPDAFLRRCVFHHLEFPENEKDRNDIVLNHLVRLDRQMGDGELRAVMRVVEWARQGGLSRKPGLAEVIDFAASVMAVPGELDDRLVQAVSALAKTDPDRAALKKHLTPTAT